VEPSNSDTFDLDRSIELALAVLAASESGDRTRTDCVHCPSELLGATGWPGESSVDVED
jgi:hypothetical protein